MDGEAIHLIQMLSVNYTYDRRVFKVNLEGIHRDSLVT